MMDVDQVWQKYASQIPGRLERRPDFRFDPDYYAQVSGLSGGSVHDLADHYRSHGAPAGMPPTRYAAMIGSHPHVDETLRGLVNNPDLDHLVEGKVPEALHLLCELIGLGDPVDAAVSDFSVAWYAEAYSDLKGADIDLVTHYLCHGIGEGRKNLGQLREARHDGARPFRSDWPTCLICVHEMSRTGAPVVGVDLAREASATHNVLVASLRDGPLLEDFKAYACEVVITEHPLQELQMVLKTDLNKCDLAIINSVASWSFVQPLIKANVPFVSYVHEYWELMRKISAFHAVLQFSDVVVFSSQQVRSQWESVMRDVVFDADKDSLVIPQRPLVIGGVGAQQQSRSRAKISQVLGRDVSQSIIVCGAGHPQWRKGTDIFVTTAQISRQCYDDVVFVWIGANIERDEINFGVYIDHHFNEAGVNDCKSNLHFLQSGPLYKDLMIASDVFYMSSRFDPLPNVVFDAVEHGCKIVHFANATGFDDDIYQDSGIFTRVEYANPKAAADAIAAAGRKLPTESPVSEAPSQLFSTIEHALKARLEAQRYFVSGLEDPNHPIVFHGADPAAVEGRRLAAGKMLRYGRRSIWRDLRDVQDCLSDSTNWVHRRLRAVSYEPARYNPAVPFSLHIHAHYLDSLARDLREYSLLGKANRIIVTTDTDAKVQEIEKICSRFGLSPEVIKVPNVGRDILPFLQLFKPGGLAGEDQFWCHIHQKKSLASTTGGDKWKQFLLRILFGNAEEISPCLNHLAKDSVGLVAPLDPNHCGWDESRRLLPKFSHGLPGELPDNPLLFPIGNMFWVRNSVARQMYDHFGPDYPWPGEPIGIDGTEYHLIERLWPTMAASLGLDSVFVYKPDEKRS